MLVIDGKTAKIENQGHETVRNLAMQVQIAMAEQHHCS